MSNNQPIPEQVEQVSLQADAVQYCAGHVATILSNMVSDSSWSKYLQNSMEELIKAVEILKCDVKALDTTKSAILLELPEQQEQEQEQEQKNVNEHSYNRPVIFVDRDYFEHLLNCLANQKFLYIPDSWMLGREKEMQQAIDEAYDRGRELLSSNR